jgi:hypothetical protein
MSIIFADGTKVFGAAPYPGSNGNFSLASDHMLRNCHGDLNKSPATGVYSASLSCDDGRSGTSDSIVLADASDAAGTVHMSDNTDANLVIGGPNSSPSGFSVASGSDDDSSCGGSWFGAISCATGRAKTQFVSGYTRSNGTFVSSYFRSSGRR